MRKKGGAEIVSLLLPLLFVVGGVLLSHILPGAVPSALVGLASGFGMGPGVSQPLSPPTRRVRAVLKNICLACVACLILHSEQRVNHVLCFTFCFLAVTLCFCSVVISTSHLRWLPTFQFWPINPIVCGEPKKPYLETGFPLRCFQRLSFPYVANQPCHGRDSWHTRGTSIPVLSY